MDDTPAPWPPEPVLGRPTEEDFARMRGEYVPPKPRRPLPRWAVALMVLAVVSGLGQLLVYAVFDGPRFPAVPGYECEHPGCGPEPEGNFTWNDSGLLYGPGY